MKHVIRIPELAQRLGVDARTAEELARDAGRGPTRGRHRSRRSLSLCVALGRSLLMNLLRARCRKGSGCERRGGIVRNQEQALKIAGKVLAPYLARYG